MATLLLRGLTFGLAGVHLATAAPQWNSPPSPGSWAPSRWCPPGGEPGHGHWPPPGHYPPPPPASVPGPASSSTASSAPFATGIPVTTTVDLGYAKYEGYTAHGVNQWLGIAFAAPPLGNLRWRAPQAPLQNTATGVLPAKNFAPTCIGYWIYTEVTDSINEDCLYLNIFSPEGATTQSKLPVWFFMQGGGYAADSDQNFNLTEDVNRSNGSMVFVQINYRVGAFGFLASKEVKQNGDLNVGLLDQRF